MIKVKRIDHVAIAVADRDASAQQLAGLFGLEAGGVDVVSLELCAPAGQDGNDSLRRFLANRGPGLHHVCFEVDDLPAALASLKAAGVRLIDETPRPGARGHLVAFLHPSATGGVLFELCAPAATSQGRS